MSAISPEKAASLQLDEEQSHKAIAELLEIALTDQPLPVKLDHALDCIFAVSAFSRLPKGCIFLVGTDPSHLKLVAHRNFPPAQVTRCAEVPFGRCVCGEAARTRSLRIEVHGDPDHDTDAELGGKPEHGHFCAPILEQDQLLGVLNIYTPPKLEGAPAARDFLTSITHVLAHMISRHQKDERLRHQRDLLESVLNNIPHRVFWKDLDLHFQGCNRNFARDAGFARPEEVVGKTDFDMPWAGEQAEYYRALDQQVLEEGRPILNYEQSMRQADGHEAALLVSKVPLCNEAGKTTGVIGIYTDISEQQALQARLRHLHLFDQLTDLPNQNLFADRVAQATFTAQREQTIFAVGILDLDNFKKINSSLGHEAGDQILRQVAGRLAAELRDYDTVARMGGDSFPFILADLHTPEEVSRLARSLMTCFSSPFELDGQEVFITASTGVALYPEDGRTAADLIRNAESALHRAKAQGHNGYQMYSPTMNASSLMLLNLESSLRRAISQNQFELFFQPQFEARTAALVGAEALIRWRHPELGLVSPADFIPLAEETGLIVEMGSWVIYQACERLQAWRQQGFALPRVAVNLSARQFHHHDIIGTVCAALLDSGLPPECLEVEITESAVMGNPEEAFGILEYFREMGVSVAVDDFGTGYSSLSYLKRFPLDMLKIDRSFIKTTVVDPDSDAIVKAIIAMAKQLRLQVLAEGVETEEQRDFLRQYGCDLFQGFLYCAPLEESTFLGFLRQRGATDDGSPPR